VPAWDITILETLALLDTPLREFAFGVAEDSYAIWLGAGISLGKLPGLTGVAETVLEHVRLQIDDVNPTCEFKVCLDNILGLVVLNAAQRATIDYKAAVATWPPIDEVKKQLVSRYGTMLDQAPASKPLDYLVWEGVQVVARYANPATTPGAEHLGLAALIMEGVASDISSANWDDLIEKAIGILDGPTSSILQVRVLPGDVQNNVRRARLYKFHGCAALAGTDEPNYRSRIVAREAQIHGWADKPENQVIAGKLVDLAISKATLMLGLSAQDTNIQEVFVKAKTQLPASFPTHPPAVIVSENQVGTHQRSLLQNFYRNDYEGQIAVINAASLVQSYAHSLLPALWLHVLCAKLSAMVEKAAPGLISADRDRLRLGLVTLRDLAASAADPADHETFMLKAVRIVGRSLSLFTRGRVAAAGDNIYTPLTDKGLTQTLVDPHLDTDGLLELSLALGLIGCGVQEGHWTGRGNDTALPKTGAIALSGVGGRSEVFFAASAHASAQLFAGGHVADDDDAIVIHSFEVPARAARHPTSAPGRTGRLALREFSVSSIAEGATSIDLLLRQFKAEMAL
jgi:SIR2-like domain